MRGTKPISFQSRRGWNNLQKSGQIGVYRVFFLALAAHVVVQIEPQDHHRELGEVEGSLNIVVPPPEVARGRKWVRVGFVVF